MLKTSILKKLVALLVVVVGALSPALANDSELGTPTGSFVVSKNPHIAMRSELLQISLNKIRVEYVYENTSDEAQNIVIGFPVARFNYDYGSPPLPHTLKVRTWIDGQEYEYQNSEFNPDEQCRSRWLERNGIFDDAGYCFQYQRSLKVFDNDGCSGQEVDLTPAQQTRIERLLSEERALGCSFIERPNVPQVEYSDVWTEYYIGNTTTYVRQQQFEPRAIVKVVHEYVPDLTGGIFDFWVEDFRRLDELSEYETLSARYLKCATEEDALVAVEAWERSLEKGPKSGRAAEMARIVNWSIIDYILTTGANWRGPIGHFRLEIFAKEPFFIATCFEGLERVADNRYAFEAYDYVPAENLSVVLHTL